MAVYGPACVFLYVVPTIASLVLIVNNFLSYFGHGYERRASPACGDRRANSLARCSSPWGWPSESSRTGFSPPSPRRCISWCTG